MGLPNGDYDIYFHLASAPDDLCQGDLFLLEQSNVSITISKVTIGNYGIHTVE